MMSQSKIKDKETWKLLGFKNRLDYLRTLLIGARKKFENSLQETQIAGDKFFTMLKEIQELEGLENEKDEAGES